MTSSSSTPQSSSDPLGALLARQLSPPQLLVMDRPAIRSVLVATDFSDSGNNAVPYAYGALPRGGTVHLLHVIDPSGRDLAASAEERARQRMAIEERLRALVPRDAELRGIRTEFWVLEGTDVARVIEEQADRLAADVVCLGTHAQSALDLELGGAAQLETEDNGTIQIVKLGGGGSGRD